MISLKWGLIMGDTRRYWKLVCENSFFDLVFRSEHEEQNRYYFNHTEVTYWYAKLKLCSRKMIRTNIKIHKDENESLYLQTFIFVLTNLSLSINDLRTIHLYIDLIRFTFECWNNSGNSALQGSVTDVRIKKYQNSMKYSLPKHSEKHINIPYSTLPPHQHKKQT